MPDTTRERSSGGTTATSTTTLVVLIVLGLLLGGAYLFSGSSARTGPAAVDLPVGHEAVSTPLDASDPAGLQVSSVGIDARPIAKLGLTEDLALQVPKDATTVGWYSRGASPGENGPSVFASHINYGGVEGGFAHLADVAAGDQVLVPRADGVTAVFVIDRVQNFSKQAFPTALVYGPTTGPEIRLITCGGTFDPAVRSFEDNVVAFGHLTEAFRS